MQLYKNTCLECSKIVTNRYSTSFSLGIKMLAKCYHTPIYGIYGFVRLADEIVDTFHDFNKSELLACFKKDTFQAIRAGISTNPLLYAFQCVVTQYHIEDELIEAFLKSMEMDLQMDKHDTYSYDEYIYGSAEVVGLMCLRVFCEGDQEMYDRLKGPAQSLGKAFQKVNFLRDMRSDYLERGRVYFPGVDFHQFDNHAKKVIEEDIAKDFDHAYEGIRKLPEGAKRGVYLAYIYYRRLFQKISQLPAAKIQEERIRVPDNQKLALLVKTYFQHQFSII